MTRRVAITGIGVVSPLGIGRAPFFDALAAGRSGIAPIEAPGCTVMRFPNGAEVRDFDALNWFDPKAATQLDRSVLFAGAAAAEAIECSGLAIDRARTAVVTGSSLGGKISEEDAYRQMYAEGRTRFEPLTIPRIMTNASASWISMRHGIGGPAYTVSSACASASHAIGQAFWMVRSGVADAAVTGGTEAPFTPGILRAWEALRVVSPDTCRPFSLERRGLILGEGAAMFVLEPLDAARARGATVWAELCGSGMSADAHHITMPSSEGAARAMRAALEDAGLRPEEIGYINAHGTGTSANDSTETQAVHDVFRVPPPVSSTKSMHGHALGAAGAIEAAATIFALHERLLPPTVNYLTPDPACDLDVVPNRARPAEVEAALSNSFAFGGLNAVLAFRSTAR